MEGGCAGRRRGGRLRGMEGGEAGGGAAARLRGGGATDS